MAESSTNNSIENPQENVPETDNNGDESPPENLEEQPENETYDFFLQLEPNCIHALTSAFSTLSDTLFNSTQKGLLVVSTGGLWVIVKSEFDDQVTGGFFLKTLNFTSFRCSNFVSKVVDVNQLYLAVKDPDENLSKIVIYTISGSNQLYFKFDDLGDDPRIVNMIDDSNREWAHEFSFSGYKYRVPLPEMIQMILTMANTALESQNVILKAATTRWKFTTGGYQRMELQSLHSRLQFRWSHGTTLVKAVELANGSAICVEFGTDDQQLLRVALRLKLHQVGYLYFLQKALRL